MRAQNCLRNSDSNSLASSLGSPHTLHWPPKLRTLGYCLCTAQALAEEEEEVLVDQSRHRSSDDNFAASSRGSAHTLRWLPNLGRTDSHRSMSWAGEGAQVEDLELAEDLQSTTHHCKPLHNCPGSHRTIRLDSFLHILHGSRAQSLAAPVWAQVLVPWSSRAATGTNQSVQRKRSGRRPIRRDDSASNKWVCSPHHRDNHRAARLDRSLACPADTPNPTTAC